VELAELVEGAPLRAEMGAASRAWWMTHHRVEAMADRYQVLMADAGARQVPEPELPAHLRDEGDSELTRLLAPFGMSPSALGW
jgi:hypothetical protein